MEKRKGLALRRENALGKTVSRSTERGKEPEKENS
jgi:hypothetical protein